MRNLSIRQILYLSLGGLLAITLVVVYSGYQHSAQTIRHLTTVIEIHSPILRETERVDRLLTKADHKFQIRGLQSSVNEDDILILFDRLLRASENISVDNDLALTPQLDRIDTTINQLIATSDKTERQKLLTLIIKNIDMLRQQLYELYNRSSSGNGIQQLLDRINIISDISTEIVFNLQQFINQTLTQLAEITNPLEQAGDILTDITQSDFIRQSIGDPLVLDLTNLSLAIDRLKSAVLFYEQEYSRLDPSEAHVDRASRLVNQMRKLVLDQIVQLNTDLQFEIEHSQIQLADSSQNNQSLFIVLSVLSTLFSVFIVVVISQTITASVGQLQEGAQHFSRGNLEYRIPRLKIREFAEFSNLFNRMASSLEDEQKKLRKSVESLNTINNELDQRVSDRTKSMEQALQEAHEANEAKSVFLSNMSHELRTPMHAILGFSELGLTKIKDSKDDHLKRYFDRIQGSGKRLLWLINDLLDLSKLETSKTDYNFDNHSIKAIIVDAANELESLLNNAGITLNCDRLDDIKCYCDRDKILQVIINLISNAIKFSPQRSEITVSSISDDESKLELIVSDQGVGIPDDQIESIFTAFFQSSATRSDAGGTGLGLSICKQIIKDHNGIINVRNRDQGGAEFIFTLPLAQEPLLTEKAV